MQDFQMPLQRRRIVAPIALLLVVTVLCLGTALGLARITDAISTKLSTPPVSELAYGTKGTLRLSYPLGATKNTVPQEPGLPDAVLLTVETRGIAAGSSRESRLQRLTARVSGAPRDRFWRITCRGYQQATDTPASDLLMRCRDTIHQSQQKTIASLRDPGTIATSLSQLDHQPALVVRHQRSLSQRQSIIIDGGAMIYQIDITATPPTPHTERLTNDIIQSIRITP